MIAPLFYDFEFIKINDIILHFLEHIRENYEK